MPFECGEGGDRLGSERTKAGRRETPRKRSERIEVILSKRDMSCFCWVLTKSLQRNTETQKCATEPLRVCLRRCPATLEKQLLHTRRGCPPPLLIPPIPHLVFASLARRSGDCCADAAPLSCLPDCRLRPLTPTTPAKEHVTWCCIIMGTKSEFNNSGQDVGIKKQLQFWVGGWVCGGGGLPVSVVRCAHPALI